MSFEISQNPKQARLAASLQERSEILNIRLVESNANCKEPLRENMLNRLPFSLAVKFRPETFEVVGRNLCVITRFNFKIISEKDKAELVVLSCLLEAEYALSEGFEPSPQQIKAFKDGPAIFNCWPYFREYVRNTVARMNYPPPTIPFLWIGTTRAARQEVLPSIPKKEQGQRKKTPKRRRTG